MKLTILILSCVVFGCAYPDQYVECKNAKSCSTLYFENNVTDEEISLYSVNGKPLTFWRFKKQISYNIESGVNDLRIIGQKEPYTFRTFTYDYKPNKKYLIRLSKYGSYITLIDLQTGKKILSRKRGDFY